MNEIDQKIALAKLCGLVPPYVTCVDELPNYTLDLNAIHEAEKIMMCTATNITHWERHLRQITNRDAKDGTGLYERLIRATASQRCEALLRTLNLWVE